MLVVHTTIATHRDSVSTSWYTYVVMLVQLTTTESIKQRDKELEINLHDVSYGCIFNA